MQQHIGAPNAHISPHGQLVAMRPILEENIDRGQQNFHHAALVKTDSEWTSICKITPIIPYVYIGGFSNAINLDQLKRDHIRCIVSVMADSKKLPDVLRMYAASGIAHVHYDAENSVTADVTGVFEAVYNIILQCVTAKKNVLIHCAQGVSTSPAVVAYYVLRNYYSRQTAQQNRLPMILKLMHDKRSCVDINPGFIEQLEAAETALSGRATPDTQSMSTRKNRTLFEFIKKGILEGQM